MLDPSDNTTFGYETGVPEVLDTVETYLGLELDTDLFSLYKDNVGGVEEGLLRDSYATTYDAEPDAMNADITYDGPPDPYVDVSSGAWLLVKDGNHSHAWYLFDLKALLWNGTDIIQLKNFWPGQGAISHVEILGTATVPEPATVLLFGSGLLGLAGFRRKRFFKK